MKKIVMLAAALSLAGSGAAMAATKHVKHAHKPATKEAPAKPAPAK
ncbi:hypothetical protein [Sandarakinorhabdus oryzae]|nr:hypothetical protein [Sandarakinorhabdus oryzae]